MRKRIAVAIAAMLLLTPYSTLEAQQKTCPSLETNVADQRFKPGQVWSYQTRPNEAGSTLTILQVDRSSKLGTIIHVRVDGLQVHNPNGDVVPSIEHMPFNRDAVLLSVTKLLRTEPSLPKLERYERWRNDCGGVYTISVADAIDVAEKTLKRP